MSDVIAYAASFVVLEPSQITLNDPDQDGDLDQYTDITVVFTPTSGDPIPWPVVSATPIVTKLKDPTTGAITEVVNTVILLVVPELPPRGCLGLFLPRFSRPRKKGPQPDDPVSSGGVMGTMSPPPPAVVGERLQKKTFTLVNPLIFYGTLA